MSASTHPSITGQIGYNDNRKSTSPEVTGMIPEVHGQIDRAFSNLQSLNDCVLALRERIGCVLTPQPPSAMDGSVPPSANRSDVANRLNSLNDQMISLRDQVITMTQNLEI